MARNGGMRTNDGQKAFWQKDCTGRAQHHPSSFTMTSISNNLIHNTSSVIEINESDRTLNPLIARGAFGHVDIALLIHWESCLSPESDNSRREVRRVSLAAIKTIPNATISSSSAPAKSHHVDAQLTREAFAELNALRLLNGHENVTPLLGFYGARDAQSSRSGGDGFGGWDWADNSSAGRGPPSSLCLVFPYHPVDMSDALNHRRLKSFASDPHHNYFHLPPVVVQSIAYDIMSALKHVHDHHILHRDVKPGNLYITKDGRIQLGDFGLAKVVPLLTYDETAKHSSASNSCKAGTTYDDNPSVTQGLCTLQYRPPELLFGSIGVHYESLDVWSAGCVLAELLTLSGPLFPGQSVLDQLGRIFHVLGTPTEDKWPGVSMLPDWNKVCFEPKSGTGLRLKIPGEDSWNNLGCLVAEMLSLDPCCRPSAQQCLQHSWLLSFDGSCKSDASWQRQARQTVVNELVPSFLQIANPIYFSPPNEKMSENERTDGTNDGEIISTNECSRRDPFAYAKHYASKLAFSRRSFPQSFCPDQTK